MKLNLSFWERERAGFILLLAAVLCVVAISAMLAWAERDATMTGYRSQLSGLVRFVAGSEGRELAGEATRAESLRRIWHLHDNAHIAYLAVTDSQGQVLADLRAPGVAVPAAPAPIAPHSWAGDRELAGVGGSRILDFYAPLFQETDVGGFLRMGMKVPEPAIVPEDTRFIAMLAVPVFLLCGLAWILYRREFSAFGTLRAQLETLDDAADFSGHIDIPESGESVKLFEKMSSLFDKAANEAREYAQRCEDLEVTMKITGFKRARLESVLEAIPNAVIVMDETGVCSFASAKLENVLGVLPEQINGKKTQEWCEDQQILEFILSGEGRSAAGRASEALRFSPQNAPEKTISVTTYPLYSPTHPEQVFGKLVVFSDVTAEVMAKHNEADFVAHISHELKTPLNVLSMYSEELLEEGENEEFRVEAINVIRDEVERLATMINNLLNITQFEMGSMNLDRQRVRLHELLQDAFDNIMRSGKGQDLQFSINVPKEMSPIFVDKDLLRIALNNLLTNAIKYNRPNGTVELSAEEDEDTIFIYVRDTGIGIDPKDWVKIFDKFYRSDDDEVRARSGHGLGLPLAMQIVQLHHGKIDVESEPGKGTQFTIQFNKQSGILRRATEK